MEIQDNPVGLLSNFDRAAVTQWKAVEELDLHVYSLCHTLVSLRFAMIRSIKSLPYIALILIHTIYSSLNAQLLNDEFTRGSGFSNGATINGVRNWSAQPGGWVAAETGSFGYASCGASWSRSLNFTALAASLEVDETVAIEAVWRGEGLVNGSRSVSVFALGISDSSLTPGGDIPALRVDVSLAGIGELRFGTSSDYVSVNLADAYTGTNTNTNWFSIRMAITRTLTANVFHISVTVVDLDKSEAIGTVEYLVEDSSTYQAVGLLPAMRTLEVLGSDGQPGTLFTASHIDRFTVEAVNLMIPDFGFEAGASSALWGASSIVENNAYSGSFAARLDEGDSGAGSGYRRTITGLRPNTAYTFRAYVKTEGGSASIGVKDYGSAEVTRSFEAPAYQAVDIQFATGEGITSATCYIYNGLGDANSVFIDDPSFVSNETKWPLLPVATGDYQLIFSDEFNSEGGIDTTKWLPEVGFKRNNEAQYYRAENLSQSGGHLIITAKREQVLNANYDPSATDWRQSRQYAYWTSGSIKTEGKFNFLYGKIVCSAKVTNLPGTWPAIWTVGGGEWPATGEIDIMENFGGKILANFATAGSGRYNAFWDGTHRDVSSLPMIDENPWVDRFHTWELVWGPDSATISMDGEVLNTFNPAITNLADSHAHPGIAPFRTFGQLLWLNLAIGGNGGGDHSGLPAETVYKVDYIRVYQKEHTDYEATLDLLNENDLGVDFQSVEGRRYSVMESTDLTNWTKSTNLRGTGQAIYHFEKSGQSSAKKFFRVEVDNSQWVDAETP